MDIPTTNNNITEESTIPFNVVRKNRLGTISLYIFLTTIFLAPLAFIPSGYASLDTLKSVIIALGIVSSTIFYTVSCLSAPRISVVKHPIISVSIGLLLSLTISTLLSPSLVKSFMGQGFETATASFIFVLFLCAFITAQFLIKDRESLLKIYSVIFISFIVLALFQVARLLGGPNFMSLGFLTTSTSTIVGKWYDLGIITAVMGLLSFFSLKFLSVGKPLKILLGIILGISTILLLIINSTLIWMVVVVVSFFMILSEFYMRKIKSETNGSTGLAKFISRFSIYTAILFVFSIVCVWQAPIIATKISQKFDVNQGEVVLPWQLTLDVASDTIKARPLFGAGPNRFGSQFLLNKPLVINQTDFWNTEFGSGFGYIPTLVVSQGVVGLVLWLLFIFFFIQTGIGIFKRQVPTADKLKKFSLISSFFIASFLWLIDILYIPSHTVLFFTAIFTGIFMSHVIAEVGTTRWVSGPRFRKVLSALFIFISIILFVWALMYIKNSVAVTYFQKGIKELNTTKNVENAQANFKKSLAINPSDIYYQALSEIDIIKITGLAQGLQAESTANPSKAPDEKVVQQIIALVEDAYGYTKKAIAMDPTNYYNYFAQARVAEIAASFKFPNAYESAKASYINALSVNPASPALYLSLARLEVSQNKSADALPYIGQALQLRQNYTEAAFLLSQIQIANNQIKEAITSTTFATRTNPRDPTLFFQLGILQYSDKNYTDAAIALENAVKLNPQYANARYFLGLSYVRLGKNEEAIAQFTEIQKTNPDNKEIELILKNLMEGKSPFTDAKPPIDSKPEKRKTLPVVDTKTTTKKK